MKKELNFAAKEAKAKTMTRRELEFAIEDCLECVRVGCDPDYYRDEISVYRAEIAKRQAKGREASKRRACAMWRRMHPEAQGCEHVSVTTPDGNGAFCQVCGETLA